MQLPLHNVTMHKKSENWLYFLYKQYNFILLVLFFGTEHEKQKKEHGVVPLFAVGVTVTEVFRMHTVILQPTGTLLTAWHRSAPVHVCFTRPAQPPGEGGAICSNTNTERT